MPLDFLQNPDGSWRAQGDHHHYRIARVRDVTGTKFRVFQSLDREPGSGTQAITGIHDTYDTAVAWCEAAERHKPPSALERKRQA